MSWVDYIGWVATSLFVASYFASPKALRIIQASAALLWITYGVALNAHPVIAANGLIFVIALFSTIRKPKTKEA